MANVSIKIPQIGEGLQEARLVAVLKKPGEKISKDEPIYQMETDKAIMDIECPYEGTLVEWLAKEDAVLPIGADIAIIDTETKAENNDTPDDNDSKNQSSSSPSTTLNSPSNESRSNNTDIRHLNIPPRTRAHAKSLGLSNEDLTKIPSKTGKLMPEDVDNWVENKPATSSSKQQNPDYPCTIKELPSKQRVLGSRLSRGCSIVVPATLQIVCDWDKLIIATKKLREKNPEEKLSPFTLFAFAVAKSVKEHPIFKSNLTENWEIREYDNLSLGIAVAGENDSLLLAVVNKAEVLDWENFKKELRSSIDKTRTGEDMAHAAVTLSLSNMQSFGVRDGIPVVVPPAAGTIFLGEEFLDLRVVDGNVHYVMVANVTMTFDHRMINGVGAAQFLNTIKQNVENIENICT